MLVNNVALNLPLASGPALCPFWNQTFVGILPAGSGDVSGRLRWPETRRPLPLVLPSRAPRPASSVPA